jgi:cytochrome P450
MNELIHIGNADISVKEYNGQRVVTFKDIDMAHGRLEGTARKRFADNRERFIENEDYFVVKPQDLENIELSEKRTLENCVTSNFGTALITEQGYLMLVKSFTDDLAWQVQRQLVNGYFRSRQLAADLSPQMQMLYGMLDQMAQTERQAKEAKEIAVKAIETTESIKQAVKPVFENWREEMKQKFNRIQKCTSVPFNYLRNNMYEDLEQRAGCDLNARLRNKKQRMSESGCTKTEINNANKMDVIEEDKRLKQIFEKIVSEYEIKYCA